MPAIFHDPISEDRLLEAMSNDELGTVQLAAESAREAVRVGINLSEAQALVLAAKIVHSVYALRNGGTSLGLGDNGMSANAWSDMARIFRKEALALLNEEANRKWPVEMS